MNQALSNEQLFKMAPSIFATKPYEKVSERYAFMTTINIVEQLRTNGFAPVRAAQSFSRIVEKKNFTKHMIRFRRVQDMTGLAVGDEFPEVVLVNSHDRSSQYELMAGLFRQACLNGVVISGANFGTVKVQHSGNIVDKVIEGSYTIINDVPVIMGKVDGFKSIQLTREMGNAFAVAAMELRYPTHEGRKQPFAPSELLNVRRHQDEGSDLWTVFNRVQENFMRGGIASVAQTGRKNKTRSIKSVNEELRLNKALWTLTEHMASLA